MIEIEIEGRGPNTMTLASLEALAARVEAAGDAPIVVTGRGDAFSAGLDLDALATLDAAGLTTLLARLERAVTAIFLHPAPTLAIVNGHAVAGGCLLVQCCDLRVATDDAAARIGMTGVAAGLTYPSCALGVLGHRLGAPRQESVLLTATRYRPLEALAVGLVDAVAPSGSLHEDARARFERLVALPRRAYGETKRALRAPVAAHWATEARATDAALVPVWLEALRRRAAARQ